MFCTNCGKEMQTSGTFCPHCGAQVSFVAPPLPRDPGRTAMPPPPGPGPFAPPPPGTSGYAGFWLRFVAYVVDSMLIAAVGFVLLVPLAVVTGFGSAASNHPELWLQGTMFFLWAGFVFLLGVGGWLYTTLFECSSWQATPGKRMLGMAVTDLYGQRIGFGRANGRFWGKLLSSIMYIGFIMIAFTDRKQGLHDMIAGTLVVRR